MLHKAIAVGLSRFKAYAELHRAPVHCSQIADQSKSKKIFLRTLNPACENPIEQLDSTFLPLISAVHKGERGVTAGIAGVARDSAPTNTGSTYSDSFTRSEYPAYPVLTPSGSSKYSQSYPSGPAGGQEYSTPNYGASPSGQYPSATQQYAPEQRAYGQQGYGNEKAYPPPPQVLTVPTCLFRNDSLHASSFAR